MLQAQSSAARDWSYHPLPVQEPKKIRATRTVYKVNHKRKLYIKSAVTIFVYALILVALCIKSATLGYEIEKLEQEVQSITTSNQRLEYQIAQESSLAHIQQVASVQLGMYKPDNQTAMAVKAVEEPVSVASNDNSSNNDLSVSQRLLDNLYASLSRLASNN